MNSMLTTEAQRERLIGDAASAVEDAFAQRGLALNAFQIIKLGYYIETLLREIEADNGH